MKFNKPVLLFEPFELWNAQQCQELIDRAQHALEKGKVYNYTAESNVRTNFISWIDLTENEKNHCWDVIRPFWDEVTWFEHPVQISRYRPGEFYDWHRDEKPGRKRSSIRHLTLTCTLQPAPGAQFELKTRTYELGQGQAVLFPSKYDHRATAPTEQERCAFTIWYMKPNTEK